MVKLLVGPQKKPSAIRSISSRQEEARLVYRGVCENLESDTRRRLVVDIGGGSTECIIGNGADIIRADSLYMGCVEFSRKFFP